LEKNIQKGLDNWSVMSILDKMFEECCYNI